MLTVIMVFGALVQAAFAVALIVACLGAALCAVWAIVNSAR